MVAQTRARHILIVLDELTDDTEARRQLTELRERIVNGPGLRRACPHAFPTTRAPLRGGGELGWIDPGNTVPVFERMMDSLPSGGISEPFKSQYGWHVVQVLERRERDATETSQRAEARRRPAGEEDRGEHGDVGPSSARRGLRGIPARRMIRRAPALTPGEPAGIGPRHHAGRGRVGP